MAKFISAHEAEFGKKTILVADDDSNDTFLLQRAFAKAALDVQVNFVTDGEQVIRYLKGERGTLTPDKCPLPELLLLDLKMPKLGGFEVLEWIRKQPGLKRLPIVVLTSSDEPEDIDRAYDLGANSYLVKPFDMQELMTIAEKLHSYWLNINRCPNCALHNC